MKVGLKKLEFLG